MKAKKENKVYTITTKQEKQRYLKEGFDIYDDEGEILEHSPLKKIAYSKYAELEKVNQKLVAENEALKEMVAALETQLKTATETPADKVETTAAEGVTGAKKTTKKA